MPNQIIHQAHKITYKWTFNQDVEIGTFWDGSPYVINKPDLKLIDMEMETEFGIEKPNTIVSDLELGFLGKEGFKGELYLNGLAKNPRAQDDISPEGKARSKGNVFDSRSFGCFNNGWSKFKKVKDTATNKWINVPLPTNADTSYSGFNLTGFLENKSKLENGGISVENGDVLLVQWSNFDINCSYKWQVSNAGGYPYQKTKNRSCCMSYGTLFVLERHPNEISFRPPVFWPEEDKKNRPLHSLAKINSLLPNASELVTNPWSKAKVPTYANDPCYRTFTYGFPLGNGTTYSQSMPLYCGTPTGNGTAYGAYYQAPLINRLQAAYSKDLTDAQRLEALRCVVQWGIDAYGSIKSFSNTNSGAGQRPCAARPWSIISGYFLNEFSMRMPETTMLSDSVRANGLLNARGYEVEGEDEESSSQIVSNRAQEQFVMTYGDPNVVLSAKKRIMASWTSLEANCYLKVVNDEKNDLDYRTLGKTHRRIFTGVGANLEQTTPDKKYILHGANDDWCTFSGDFAKIQWQTVPAELKSPWAASHDGKAPTFWYSYIKVIEGSGAGETLYRIIKPWGDFRNAKPQTELNISGYGFILDRPWQHGQPDETSKFQMITCIENNVGEVFYLIGPTRYIGMADANLSPTTPYAGICQALLVPLYGWMNYIEKKTGASVDLDKDSTHAHEYVYRTNMTSPYNWVTYSTNHSIIGTYPWQQATLNMWYFRPSSNVEIAKTIDWSTIPGIKTWLGVDVSNMDYKLIGDFNNDGVVDAKDQTMFLSAWGTTDSEYDLDGDGLVNQNDLAIFLSQFGKTKDNN